MIVNAIGQEIRQAIGRLSRSPGFTLLAVGIFALGLGATLYMSALVRSYVLAPLPWPDAGRIVYVSLADARGGGSGVPAAVFEEWQRSQRSFAALTAYYTNSVTLADGAGAERVSGAFVTPAAFGVAGTQAHIGRTLAASDAAPGAPWVIVLGYEVWKNRYDADPAILGRSLRAGGVLMTVVGVMPPGFHFPAAQQVWVPLRFDLTDFAGAQGRWLDVGGRLRSGVTVAQARSELSNLTRALAADVPESRGMTAAVEPFQQAYVTPATRGVVWAMFAAVVFVLLIACANVANLLLARTLSRERDVALRAALGAGRGRILAQVLTESLLLAAAGAALGYLLAGYGLELTRRAFTAAGIEQPFWIAFEVDRGSLAVVGLAAVLSALAAGIVPAVRCLRTDVNEHLKAGSKGGGDSPSRSTGILVTAQIAACCVLLVSAGLMIRTVANLEARPLGVEHRKLLTGSIDLPFTRYPEPDDWWRFYEALTDRLKSNPDVIDATVSSSYPGMNSWVATYRVPGVEVSGDGPQPLAQYVGAMDNYAGMLGIDLLQGRWFDSRDRAGSEPVAIVDARFAAKVFPGLDPVGRQIALEMGMPDEPPTARHTIVGVTEPVFMDRRADTDRPAVFVPLAQNPYVFLKVAVRTRGEPLAFADDLRETVRRMDPELAVFWVRTYDNWLWAGDFDDRGISAVLGVFSAIAVALAAAGIYGVLACAVGRRTREIGLRRALGAIDGRIVGLVIGQSLRQLGIGLAIGLCCAVAFAALLGSRLQGVEPFDPPTIVAVAAILTAIAAFSSLIPVLRAVRVDPADALRAE